MKHTIALCLLCAATAANAASIEPDSAAAIASRTRADFPYTIEQFHDMLSADRPGITRDSLQRLIDTRLVETHMFGDTLRVFRKALGNLRLLDPATNPHRALRGSGASDARISYVDSVLDWREGTNLDGGAHRVRFSFSIDVPVTSEIAFDTLRVWMPYPLDSDRQSDIRLIETSHSDYTLSGENSPHGTIFFQQPSGAPGDTAHFRYVAEFTAKGAYFPEREILSSLKPYDKESELYRKYTSVELPHIIRLDSLAAEIAGDETNPYRLSERVYDYIINRYPWAGAREYSTIECIPEYVITEGHGDCGQVSLLYISLMRTLGIPARWESGWMLHPGEKNLHDWAEVYFEGVGWVPVDVSFGRYTRAGRPEATGFYSHGIDAHRFVANKAVAAPFYPAKRFVRSETVDSQLGEVETTAGNLFYPDWTRRMELINVTPAQADRWALVTIPVASMRTRGAHAGEMSTQAVMGMPLRIWDQRGEWYHAQTLDGYDAWVPTSSVQLLGLEEIEAWRANPRRMVVNSLWQIRAWQTPKTEKPTEVVTDLMLGSIVEAVAGVKPTDGRTLIQLPDGRRGWVDSEYLTPINEWADQPFNSDKILETAYSMEGSPYLWGGTSAKSVDCSGLVKVSYLNNGLVLMRDASQQARTGKRLEADEWPEYQPGDLMFFGNSSTGRVTHVAIYDHDGRYIHSSGRVKRNSVDPESPDYLYSPLHSVRIHGMEGTRGITRAIDHPWLFNTNTKSQTIAN
ncbi:MAG: C40 family peptidase [Muribaculaceae bacterium]|nr:C40 family peptidase [Muribaculaceae bacterium]